MEDLQHRVKESAEIEFLMSNLYSLVAEKVDEHKPFWQELAEEEHNHGKLLMTILKSLGYVGCLPEKLAGSEDCEIDKAKKLIHQKMDEISNAPSLGCKDACDIALNLEKVLPEIQFQQFMEADDYNEIGELIRAMNEDEYNHLRRIKHLYNNL